jgi:hypothetical protein
MDYYNPDGSPINVQSLQSICAEPSSVMLLAFDRPAKMSRLECWILGLRCGPISITVTVTTLCSSQQIRTVAPGRLRTLLTGSTALPAN